MQFFPAKTVNGKSNVGASNTRFLTGQVRSRNLIDLWIPIQRVRCPARSAERSSPLVREWENELSLEPRAPRGSRH